jgi:hypothetical protein
VSAGKRKRVEPSGGTRTLLDALSHHGVQIETAAKSIGNTSVVEAVAASGAMSGILLFDGRLELPLGCFQLILAHCGTKSLLTSVQRIAKGWLSACREPSLYKSLDCLPLAITMTPLLVLLKQPKFSRVERLVLHHKIKLGKTGAKQLGAVAKHLKHIDACSDHHLHLGDHDVLALVEAIPTLSSLRLDMWNATSYGISQAAVHIGARLQHLHIQPDNITEHYMSDASLLQIARGCPELNSLSIRGSFPGHNVREQRGRDGLTHNGLLALLGLLVWKLDAGVLEVQARDGGALTAQFVVLHMNPEIDPRDQPCCKKLETLKLKGTINVGLCLFQSIADRKSGVTSGGLALKTLHTDCIHYAATSQTADPTTLQQEVDAVKVELASLLDFNCSGAGRSYQYSAT